MGPAAEPAATTPLLDAPVRLGFILLDDQTRFLTHITLVLQVFDWEKSGSHRCLGIAKVTVQEVAHGTKQLKLCHPTNGHATKAELSFEGMCLVERPTFLDFLSGGLQLGFTVAIDFTASNKPPQEPGSLHNMLQSPNQYEAAIQAVGNVIEYYNQTKYARDAVAPCISICVISSTRVCADVQDNTLDTSNADTGAAMKHGSPKQARAAAAPCKGRLWLQSCPVCWFRGC